MGTRFIVIECIRAQDATQVLLAEDHEVVNALATDRTISRSAKQFCQGDPREIGLSRIPTARNRRLKTVP
jgi:hypothetical protein